MSFDQMAQAASSSTMGAGTTFQKGATMVDPVAYLIVVVVSAAIGLVISYSVIKAAVKNGTVAAMLEVDVRKEVLANAREKARRDEDDAMTNAEKRTYRDWTELRRRLYG